MTLPTIPDPLALHLLTLVAGPLLRASPTATPPTPDLLAALTETFGPTPEAPAPTDAALARAALSVAVEEPATAAAVAARLDAGTPESFAVLETTLAVTAALAILQTELTFERTPAGKWKVKLHKKAASDAVLKALAQAIVRALGGAGEKHPPALPK